MSDTSTLEVGDSEKDIGTNDLSDTSIEYKLMEIKMKELEKISSQEKEWKEILKMDKKTRDKKLREQDKKRDVVFNLKGEISEISQLMQVEFLELAKSKINDFIVSLNNKEPKFDEEKSVLMLFKQTKTELTELTKPIEQNKINNMRTLLKSEEELYWNEYINLAKTMKFIIENQKTRESMLKEQKKEVEKEVEKICKEIESYEIENKATKMYESDDFGLDESQKSFLRKEIKYIEGLKKERTNRRVLSKKFGLDESYLQIQICNKYAKKVNELRILNNKLINVKDEKDGKSIEDQRKEIFNNWMDEKINEERNEKIGQKDILKKDLEDVLNRQDDIIELLKEEINKNENTNPIDKVEILKKDIKEVENLGKEIRGVLYFIESLPEKDIIKFYDDRVGKYLTKIYDLDMLSTDLKHNPSYEKNLGRYFEVKELREKKDTIEKSRDDIKNSKVNIVKRLKQRKEIKKEVEEKSKEIIKLNSDLASKAYKSPNMPYNINYNMFKLQKDIGNLRNINGKKNNIKAKIKNRVKKFFNKNKNFKNGRGM